MAPAAWSAPHGSESSDISDSDSDVEDDEEMRSYRAKVVAMALAAMEASDSDGDDGDDVDARDAEYARRSLALSLSHWGAAATASTQHPTTDMPKLSIAMLVKTPRLSALKTFIQYHHFLGVAHFEFFFDDTVTSTGTEPTQVDAGGCNDPAADLLADVAEFCPHAVVVAHRCTLEFWARAQASSKIWGEFGGLIWKEVIARQSLAIEVAVTTTTAAGCAWLIHIDGDEALSFGKGTEAAAASKFFASIPQELDQVTFLNHEAAPETDTADDWFREVKHFKTNPACGGQEPFVAYSNGKSAVRLQPGVVPSGVHRFRSLPNGRKLVSRWVTPCIERYAEDLGEVCIGGVCCDEVALFQPCLLHYVNCNFQDWKRKYENVQSRTQSVFGFADAYKTDSTESRQLQEAIDATKGSERATCSIAEDGATSAERAKAERALRIAYRDKIVYDVRSGAKGDACLKGGRLIHADIVSSVCEAADAARAVTVTTGLVECSA